ncbi:MAG TPA: prolyl oligopeptidase family serine peptidase [Candidatus Paceibacterota bacterium]|nr:prolyl oligopeptidase family serine peptidase [Candidatus Paceibacterota bacterium]
MPYALRTRFKKEIVAEFLPPVRAGKRQRVVIICDGAPTVPARSSLVQFFSKKGFWAIYPRYRGTWESDGVFLRRSPEQDVLDVIDSLPRGFKDLWSGKTYRVQPDEVFIVATSFGGPAGILASRDPRVSKVVAVSPVVDWQAPSKAEPINAAGFRLIHETFGNGYRFGLSEWKKLAGGKFYNPVRHAAEIDGAKLLIFHARDDQSVRWNEVARFACATGATLKLFKKGGHLSGRRIVPGHWNRIAKFLKKS